ncbi:Bacterioferritin comigratory protein [Mycoplasma yeatsii 13926]|uniref:thioredoxin-dependent peroxiredoxin n=1 Tax=Mycoplasma yeatsii 13926 TaxID=1188240 RepID=S6G883_9MOLU|nr:peroxiredoxin [Mycoplasma yeatsii]EOA07279.1 Bacterioferritin comigratory protein [Mycoplasma yeatsii 13926]
MKNYQVKDCKNNLMNLSDLVGEKGLVIYFYPKAKTGLCTLEALEYQKHLNEFKNKGYNVVGVSQDTPEYNNEFCCEQNLEFTLICDVDKELTNEFKLTFTEIEFEGKPWNKYERSTFVLDKELNIVKEMRDVDHIEHVSELLSQL